MYTKRIILAGMGPHARRIYFPFLQKHAKKYRIEIPLIIDLESQREVILRYLSAKRLRPEKLYFIDDKQRCRPKVDGELHQVLAETIAKGCDGIIISSEAKTHKMYLLWALENNVDILTDKPITAPVGVSTSVQSAERVFDNFVELEERLRQSTSNLLVQCQRRSHKGYQLVRRYLMEFLQEFQIPISYLNIYHADGMWGMPPELFYRENHPYKYGYGKLMHSGYHFIDLFVWLSMLNDMLVQKAPDNIEMFVQTFRPVDFLHQVDKSNYQQLFNTKKFCDFFSTDYYQQAKNLGELDAFIQCQLKRNGSVITTGSIDLQQNSFSRRAWTDEPSDVYKGNGRVRHERVNIQVANLLNIQVHSYQSYEVNKVDTAIAMGDPGHDAHFDIHIYRNSDVVGGVPFETLTIGKADYKHHRGDQSYLGHNEKARESIFLDFLNRRASSSHFLTHKRTNLLLANIYKCIAQAHSKQIPYNRFAIE